YRLDYLLLPPIPVLFFLLFINPLGLSMLSLSLVVLYLYGLCRLMSLS
ncbi:unnamed protein product, partial [Brassica rapa subsp. narinosa]